MVQSELMTVGEVADYLRVHYVTAYDYIRNGKFPNAIKPAGKWLVPRSDVEALLQRRSA